MADMRENGAGRRFRARHRGRGAQVLIYLGKLLRMFVYQSDWKVLPMAALIAGLVGMVVRRRFFINMEGTLMGAFAMVCVCIWNGCFNSIQVICRERDVIKREHRSGMHISSYIAAHMLYQALLCLAQTGVTLYITALTGVQYPREGLFTRWYFVDAGISMFLITYASDMLSLWVSALSRTTTTAMTVMPFVLIFQLVFSGGMLSLPAWTEPLTYFTVSNPGLKVIAAQADTNDRPFVTISNMIEKMRDSEISGTVTPGQVLDALSDEENQAVRDIRGTEINVSTTFGALRETLEGADFYEELRNTPLDDGTTFGETIDMLDATGATQEYADMPIEAHTTVGELVDMLSNDKNVRAHWDDSHTFTTTVGNVLDLIGEEQTKLLLEEKAAEASYVPAYDNDRANIAFYWLHLIAFIIAFALLATVTLEFIDKDKR
ncbi:MAG: ABC transporter permease [Clostridiales bacterium]|nr:ABC transporter permease [Clostridiales bacterium]